MAEPIVPKPRKPIFSGDMLLALLCLTAISLVGDDGKTSGMNYSHRDITDINMPYFRITIIKKFSKLFTTLRLGSWKSFTGQQCGSLQI